MRVQDLQGKRILLVGYGVEGKATRKFLKRYAPSVRVGIADATQGPRYLDKQKEYDLAIRSPGVRPDRITIPYTTATNIFFAHAKGTIIGITGSKGKSTTAALVYAMLTVAGKDARLVGNIGTPMLAELLKPATKKTIYVCELSSFQTMDSKYTPHISAILNLYEEHLDFHDTRAAYWRAKEHVLAYATPRDYFVYNPAFPRLVKLAHATKAKALPVVENVPFSLEGMALKGAHNEANIRVAFTIARIVRVPIKTIREAIRTFRPLPHRLQPIGVYHGIEWYDDSIATIPEAAMSAINALGSRVETVMLGGFDRGVDVSKLGAFIARHTHIRSVILFPVSGMRIGEAIRAVHGNVKQYPVRSMKEAVAVARRVTTSGKICLLSPASPSFGLFKDFKDRGMQFTCEVKRGTI